MDQLGFSLYLITDRAAAPRPPADVVEECLAAGLRAVQLREKDLEARDLLALADTLREATRRHGARLVVNDRADVALAAARRRRPAHARLAAGRRRCARSRRPASSWAPPCTRRRRRGRPRAQGADFIVFGPVYDTASKRRYGPPQGLAALETVAGAVDRPVLAVGGLTPERVPEVLAAGAAGVAVIGAIYAAARPADATKAFLDALGKA